jgi:hypothetical protein
MKMRPEWCPTMRRMFTLSVGMDIGAADEGERNHEEERASARG